MNRATMGEPTYLPESASIDQFPTVLGLILYNGVNMIGKELLDNATLTGAGYVELVYIQNELWALQQRCVSLRQNERAYHG